MKFRHAAVSAGTTILLILILLTGIPASVIAVPMPSPVTDETVSFSGTGTGHRLMIICPHDFEDELDVLVEHKNATFMPTVLITLEYIYSNYAGADEPDQIKHAIEDYVDSDNVEYVMLVGDCDTFPIRWQLGHLNDHLIGDDDDPANDDKIFVASDYYYADLYNDTGAFNDWDADGDGYYGEIYRTDLNPDGIDPVPDVAIGRVPVSDAAQLQMYIDKVIDYETSTYQSDWFQNLLLIQKEWTDDIHAKEAIATALGPLGFQTTRLYEDILPEHYAGYIDGIPSVSNITDAFNEGYGFVSELYHGSPESWDYLFRTANVSSLTNAPMLPVIYSGACDTGLYYGQNIPYRQYTDIDGAPQPKIDPGLVGDTVPPTPDPLQINPAAIGMGESFLVSTANGGIAYYGCLVTGETKYHKVLDEAFFTAFSLDHRLLGDMWEYAVNTFATTYDLQNLVANDTWDRICMMHTPSRFVLLGDPSLRVGGINAVDEPPGVDWSVLSAFNARGMDITLDNMGVTVAGYAWDPDGFDYWAVLESYDQYGRLLNSVDFSGESDMNRARSIAYDEDNERYLVSGDMWHFFSESGHDWYQPWVWLTSINEDLDKQWDYVYDDGQPYTDRGDAVVQDGTGFIVGGWRGIDDNGGGSGYLLRTNTDGSTDWQAYLAPGDDTTYWLGDEIFSVEKTSDGGLVLGTADGIVKASLGTGPAFQWQAGIGEYHAAKQTADGGYIGVGRVAVDVPEGDNYYDLVITKLDASGDVAWSETYGRHAPVLGATGMNDVGYDVRELVGEGYLVTGSTESYAYHGGSDMLLARFSLTGEVVWDMSLGTEGNDEGRAMIGYFDGGAIVTGRTEKYGISRIWTVAVNGEKYEPVAGFSYTPDSPVFIEDTVRFTADGSGDYGTGWLTDYIWDFGDGTTGTGYMTTHSYHTPGTYTVTLYVHDDEGLVAEASETIITKNMEVQWDKYLGGTKADAGMSIIEAIDDGYIIAGYTESFAHRGNEPDAWLVKIDGNGNIVWDQAITDWEHRPELIQSAQSVARTHDNGYIFVGKTEVNDVYSGSTDRTDLWLVKTDIDGNPLWYKTYGGDYSQEGNSIAVTSDGGFIIAGQNISDEGKGCLWLIKTDADGNIEWDELYDHSTYVYFQGYAVSPTSDGGYIASGRYASASKTVPLIYVDSEGTEQWRKEWTGSSPYAWGAWVAETPDGGYTVAGGYNHHVGLMKTDSDGIKLWDRTLGDAYIDEGYSAALTPDGGFIITGITKPGQYIYDYLYVIKADSQGDKQWDMSFGTDNYYEGGYGVMPLSNGGCIILGNTNGHPTKGRAIWLIKIGPNSGPTAAFTFDPADPVNGETVHFDAGASTDNLPIPQYLWHFGDGQTGTGRTPDHEYTNPGTYYVTLTVIDSDGAEDSITQPVIVTLFTGPIANAGGPYSADEGEVVYFNGNGSSGSLISYDWDFGDGATGTGTSPEHTYAQQGTYTVILTVDDGSETDTDTTTVQVSDLAPTAAFTWTPEPQDEGATVFFTDMSTSSLDTIISWSWDFATLESSTEQNPSFIFMSDGTHSVTLTVTDDDGSTDSISLDVTINDLGPTAALSGDTVLNESQTGSYDANGSVSHPDHIIIYQWDWDYDGADFAASPDTGRTQTHAWETEGEYTVAMRIIDEDGSPDMATLDVTVQGYSVDFSSDVTSGAAPLTVMFTSAVTNGTPPYTYAWDFDTNGTDESAEADPTFIFTKPGVYTVTLEVTDDVSAVRTKTKTGYIVVTGISNDDAGVTITTADVSDDPESDPGTYDPTLAPHDIDWDTARGFNLAAAGPDGTYEFRITFETSLTSGSLLYKIDPVSGEWTEISYTVIDGHTIEVTLEIIGGELDPPFVLAGDGTPPQMQPVAEAQGSEYSSAPVLSLLQFDDGIALDDGWYQLDSFSGTWLDLFTDAAGNTWQTADWALPGFDTLADGSHTVYFMASDDYGNVEGESGEWSWQFTKKTTTSGPGGPVGGGIGGGGGGTDDKRFTTVSPSAMADGVLWEEVIALSVDARLELVLPEGTKVLNANGYPLFSITVATLAEPGEPPADTGFIGNVYSLLPQGTTFDPLAILNLYYDEEMLPEGSSEADLCIYTFNETSGTWEALDCIVDIESNCVTTHISHFSDYAIIAGTRPADFSVGQLSITPRTVETGESVTVSCDITNNGDLAGSYEAVLKLDGEELQTRTISLARGESTTVSLTIRTGEAGRYTLSIGQAQGSLTVEAPSATPVTGPEKQPAPASFTLSGLSVSSTTVAPDEPVTISTTVINTGELEGSYIISLRINGQDEGSKDITLNGGLSESVSFTTSRSEPGTYTVDCNGENCEFTVNAPETQTTEVIGTVAGGAPEESDDIETGFPVAAVIIGGVVIIGLIATVIIIRRRKS